jgi:hypothetical protein
VHYVHPLDDLLGGLCDAGYVVTRLAEWSPDADGQPPGTAEHRGTYIPTVLTVLARRRGERVRTGGQP